MLEIRSDETVERLFALGAGLHHLPERGRRVPELHGHPEYEIIREIILPGKARIFYLFVPDSDEVVILGLLPKGREFHRKALGHYFNP